MEQMKQYDVAIIGSGPAGISAALNLKIRNKSFVIFGQENLSNKLELAPKIDNYLGFPGISGKELTNNFKKHIDDIGIKITYEKVTNVYSMGSFFAVVCNDKSYKVDAVILATGVNYGKLLQGEEKLVGKGVSYCATCDGPLYKGKEVAVVGYNQASLEEVDYLKGVASKVYFVPMFKGQFSLGDNVEVIHSKIKSIEGENSFEKIIFEDKELTVSGLFILRDSVAPDVLMPGLKSADGHIEVNRNLETNIKGAFAAGDCIGKPYGYIKSAGEGQIASLNAVSYLYEKAISNKNK
ncbi:NAD(P)/FAD-dependent oxidoreductase [Clostridium sp. ATCC 25772]|uniref:NAD(P)/FAD-dependent oxidoreductase n=1 Tax=Clostridium sp. ATCC 25772 TaxID=1676991 RepID=UPI0009E8E170|nr:NAD(P)/FAD-dependent oxidoreductase [Clostridium sp. ATCC 25772]